MCMSPHQMTSARIEEIIAAHQRYADEYRAKVGKDAADLARYYDRKIEEFTKILKDRAEAGTLDTAHEVDSYREPRAYVGRD